MPKIRLREMFVSIHNLLAGKNVELDSNVTSSNRSAPDEHGLFPAEKIKSISLFVEKGRDGWRVKRM